MKRSLSFWMTIRVSMPAIISSIFFATAANANAADVTLKVAYSADYELGSPAFAVKWFGDVKEAFEKSHPGVTVQLVPIQGGYDDFLTKLSLMFGNSDQSPDVAEVPGPEVGQWAASDYLLPLNDRLGSSSWWPKFVDSVKAEGTIDGQVYAPSNGVNTNALIFDKTVFSKAGLPGDWKPKSWNEVLDAARAIKKAEPDLWPLWILAGNAAGTSGAVLGPANLLAGATDPVFHDAKNDKWIVDSTGIREVLKFYQQAAQEKLLAPPSQILNSNGPGLVGSFFPKHQLGIALGGNYVPLIWDKDICAPCWPEGATVAGVAPLPTSHGQAPGVATAMSGWNLTIAKSTKNPDLAWQLLDSMMQKERLLEIVNYGGFVPPINEYNTEPHYVDLWPTTQTFFANLVPVGQTPPSVSEYKVWAYALGQATETMVLKPQTSIDDVIGDMKRYVEGQLGADKVEIRQ